MNTMTSFHPKGLLLAIAVLATAVTIASLSGVLMKLPPQTTPALIWAPIMVGLFACSRFRDTRSYMLSIPLVLIVVLQSLRAPVGVWFLFQEASGALPSSFASLAGWGDLAYGLVNIGMLISWQALPRSRTLFAIWNVVGLIEILSVNISAMRIILTTDNGPAMRETMTSFPTVWIPLLLASSLHYRQPYSHVCADKILGARIGDWRWTGSGH